LTFIVVVRSSRLVLTQNAKYRENVEFSRAIAMPSEVIIAIPHALISLLWFRVRGRAALELELVAPHAPTDGLGKRCRHRAPA
jgi:hypothetical protein